MNVKPRKMIPVINMVKNRKPLMSLIERPGFNISCLNGSLIKRSRQSKNINPNANCGPRLILTLFDFSMKV